MHRADHASAAHPAALMPCVLDVARPVFRVLRAALAACCKVLSVRRLTRVPAANAGCDGNRANLWPNAERCGAYAACCAVVLCRMKARRVCRMHACCMSHAVRRKAPLKPAAHGNATAGLIQKALAHHAVVHLRSRANRAQSWCRCGRGAPKPGADVGGVSPVLVKIWHGWPVPVRRWQGRVQSRCRCGKGVRPVPVQMSQRRAQSPCRCRSGEPSPRADVAERAPVQMRQSMRVRERIASLCGMRKTSST